jgi:hypothetical protein
MKQEIINSDYEMWLVSHKGMISLWWLQSHKGMISTSGEELRPLFGRTLMPSVLDRAFKGEL